MPQTAKNRERMKNGQLSRKTSPSILIIINSPKSLPLSDKMKRNKKNSEREEGREGESTVDLTSHGPTRKTYANTATKISIIIEVYSCCLYQTLLSE